MDNFSSFNLKRLVFTAEKGELIVPLTLALSFATLTYASEMASLLFHGNCTMCHVEDRRVSAPSIIEVKAHYKSAFSKKEDFIKYMSQFVLHPKAKLSIMHSAIEKHGLMPELGYNMETLEEITEYIYETDFTKVPNPEVPEKLKH